MKSPVNILKRGEIPGLFTETFYYLYDVWRFFHFGFGLPDGMSWDQLDDDCAEALLNFEMHFQNNFSQGTATIKYLEAIARMYSEVHGGKKGKR